MAQKAFYTIKLSDNLSLSECKNGFWLYDHIQQMNLSMKAKTEREAFIQALSYYQKKDIESKKVFIKLDNAINTFIESVRDNEDI